MKDGALLCRLFLAMVALIGFADSLRAQANVVGPQECVNSCTLNVPIPSSADRSELERLELGQPAGQTYSICNRTHCADYQRTSNSWSGSNLRERQSGSSSGGICTTCGWEGPPERAPRNIGNVGRPSTGCLSAYDDC